MGCGASKGTPSDASNAPKNKPTSTSTLNYPGKTLEELGNLLESDVNNERLVLQDLQTLASDKVNAEAVMKILAGALSSKNVKTREVAADGLCNWEVAADGTTSAVAHLTDILKLLEEKEFPLKNPALQFIRKKNMFNPSQIAEIKKKDKAIHNMFQDEETLPQNGKFFNHQVAQVLQDYDSPLSPGSECVVLLMMTDTSTSQVQGLQGLRQIDPIPMHQAPFVAKLVRDAMDKDGQLPPLGDVDPSKLGHISNSSTGLLEVCLTLIAFKHDADLIAIILKDPDRDVIRYLKDVAQELITSGLLDAHADVIKQLKERYCQ